MADPTPSHRHRNRADVQGLRALAVALVIAFHSGAPLPGGFIGVDVFFVISGFVITGTLLSDLDSHGRIHFTRFYARRVKRLLPALAVVLLFVAIVGTLAAPALSQRSTALTGVAASIFAANAYLFSQLTGGYFSADTTLNALLHTWTLAVEEQFYLLFPLILAVCWRTRSGRERRARARAGTVVAAIAVASFVFSLVCSYGHAPGPLAARSRDFAFYSSPTRAWEFAVGALIALAVPALRSLPAIAAEIPAAAGLLSVVIGARLIHGTQNFPGVAALAPVLGTGVVITAGSVLATRTSKLLSAAPIVWIGDRSYSLYLWHWPLIVFTGALWPGRGDLRAAAGIAAVIPAWASYRWVENPIRHNLRLRGARVIALAAVCVLVPIAACVLTLVAQHMLRERPAMRDYWRSQDPHADVTHGCDSTTPLNVRPADSCVWHVPNSSGVVALLGDSNAGHFTEAVTAAANQSGHDALVVTNHACPFVELRVDVPGYDVASCHRYYEQTLNELIRRRPAAAVISNGSSFYVDDNAVSMADSKAGPMTRGTEAKAALWQAGLEKTLERLSEAGIAALVVHQAPLVPQHGCAVVLILAGHCDETLPRATVAQRRRMSRAAETAAVAIVPGARTLDLTEALCNPSRCETKRKGLILYRDCCHVTVAADTLLVRPFRDAITALLNSRAR